MKILLIMILLTLISVLYHVSTVYALTGVTSNPVTTKVGTPTGPPPGASNKPAGSTSPTDSGPLGATVTCPLFQNGQGTPRIICGTGRNYLNNCGHGAPKPYYLECKSPPYAVCPFSPQLKAAVDVRPQSGNGNGAPVYFPYINGDESVEWIKTSGPISLSNGLWGVKLEYTTTSANNKRLRIDFSHVNQGNFPAKASSGQQLGVIKSGFDTDGGGHLHVAVSVNDVWGDSIDQTFICSNRSP